MNKKRIIKDYENLPEDVLSNIKLRYPKGFAQNLVYYTNKDGKRVSALPFDAGDIYYLVRMTVQEAEQIIEDDEDYDDDGMLRDDFSAEEYSESDGYNSEHFESSPVGFHRTENAFDEEEEPKRKGAVQSNLLTGMSEDELDDFAGDQADDDDDDDDDDDF